MQKIKKHLGEIFTTVGVFIFSYNIFNFSNHNGGFNLPGALEGYDYAPSVLTMIALGSALITIGILIMRNKK